MDSSLPPTSVELVDDDDDDDFTQKEFRGFENLSFCGFLNGVSPEVLGFIKSTDWQLRF